MPRRPPWDTGITPPEVERFVASHAPGRAIDLGCGTGTNAVYLARHGWSAVGVRPCARYRMLALHFCGESRRLCDWAGSGGAFGRDVPPVRIRAGWAGG